jgi:hypothetical protein
MSRLSSQLSASTRTSFGGKLSAKDEHTSVKKIGPSGKRSGKTAICQRGAKGDVLISTFSLRAANTRSSKSVITT